MRPAPDTAFPRVLLALGALILASGLTGTARGQSDNATDAGADVRYTYALTGVSLADALDVLLDETRIDLVFESDLVRARTTFCRAEKVDAEGLLRCILKGTGVDFIRLSSGTYVLIPAALGAPAYARLIGQVIDAETGTPLPDAAVFIPDQAAGAATNRDGRFAFAALRPGTHRIVISHVGYHARTDSVRLDPSQSRSVAVSMRPRIVLAEPVVIDAFGGRLPSDALGTAEPSPDLVDRGGVAGVGAPLGAVVGVHLGEALADVHVQGGASNEQQFVLDGVPVFVPVPNGGFIGPFSPFGTGRVTVYKAGFGASKGSLLSGVIDVEHRLGAAGSDRFTLQVDPLSINARWSERLQRQGVDATWMVALRSDLWPLRGTPGLERLFRRWATPDPFLREKIGDLSSPVPDAAAVDQYPLEVGFQDLHAAGHVRLGAFRSVHVSLYRGQNSFGVDYVPQSGNEDIFDEAYSWVNRTAQMRYEWVAGSRAFLNITAWGSGYELVHPFRLADAASADSDADLGSEDFNEVGEAGLRFAGDVAAGQRHTVSAALEAVRMVSNFALSIDPFGATPAGPDEVRPAGSRFGGFLEDRIALGGATVLTLGSRLTYLPSHQRAYVEPRVALQYDRQIGPGSSWAVRTAAGRYRQFVHSFDVATYNITSLFPRTRYWLPVGRTQPPPEAYHLTGAFLYRPTAGWELGLETYYKHQPTLLVLNYGAPQEDLFARARGYAHGVAFNAVRDVGRLRLETHYEYAVARRRVANRFAGGYVPVPWDAPHRVFASTDVRLASRWTANLRWQATFDRSWGYRRGYYDFLEPDPDARLQNVGGELVDLGRPGAHRLPALVRLDAGVAYSRRVGAFGVQARASAINVTGRRNVVDWSLRTDSDGNTSRLDRQAVGFIPSLSLRVSR